MHKITDFFKQCPTITTGTITAIVAAAMTVIVAFGADLTKDQRVAVMGLVAALAPLIVGGFGKLQTVPAQQVIAHEDPASGQTVAGQAAAEQTGTPIDVATHPVDEPAPEPDTTDTDDQET